MLLKAIIRSVQTQSNAQQLGKVEDGNCPQGDILAAGQSTSAGRILSAGRTLSTGKYVALRTIPILYFTHLLGIALGLDTVDYGFQEHYVDPRPLLTQKGLIVPA